MALNNIQLRVERTLFEAIRLNLIVEGYLPDISDLTRYPEVDGKLTTTAQSNWDTDLLAIKNAQNFAAEVFGHSSSQSKGLKRTPRIVILPRRIIPGDIGFNPGSTIHPDPLSPDAYIRTPNPPEAANLQLEISLVSSTADQDRFLHAIISRVFGAKKYLAFYDNPYERFFIRQLSFFDLPNDIEGIDEKVYVYEVTDLYQFDDALSTPVSLINEITVDTTITELKSILDKSQAIIGPFIHDGNLHIDLSGVTFN